MRVARYIRVSRADQRPELQYDETADFIDRRGWRLVDTFEDRGVSGSKARRPELDRMLELARQRRIDGIVVYKADRLFRSLHHMVAALAELDALGVAFVSCTEPFDTSTPQGRLMLHIVSAMAEFERGLLIERTRDGLAATRKRGTKLGRKRAKIDVDRALELRSQGLSYADCAAALACSVGSLHRLLVAHGA